MSADLLLSTPVDWVPAHLTKKQLTEVPSSSINATQSADKFGFIFDKYLSFSDQISSL